MSKTNRDFCFESYPLWGYMDEALIFGRFQEKIVGTHLKVWSNFYGKSEAKNNRMFILMANINIRSQYCLWR